MTRTIGKIGLLGLLFMLAMACERPELPVEPPAPGNVEDVQAEMGSDYAWQLYFDLDRNLFVGSNEKIAWDLGFESSVEGRRIWLNSARGGAVALAGTNDWSAVTDANGLDWAWDSPAGNMDSTAFGDFRADGQIRVVDRGYDPLGTPTGYRKVQVVQWDQDSWTLRIAELDGSGDTTVTITKDHSVNQTAFSFETNSVVEIEPPKGDWDLHFTQYTHIFHDPVQPYLVTGVRTNPNGVAVARDSALDFSQITLQDTSLTSLDTALNVIGYDWKYFDFNASEYTVFPDINFLIRDTDGRFFKLHFIDFYNDQGEKGAPRFEFQAL